MITTIIILWVVFVVCTSISISRNKIKIKEINYTKIDNIVFDDIYHSDHPDYCDAYIETCDINGIPATEEQLEEINYQSDFVHEKLMDYLN